MNTLMLASLGLALLLAVVVLVTQMRRRRALETLLFKLFQHGRNPTELPSPDQPLTDEPLTPKETDA